jgi:hypothetical protein
LYWTENDKLGYTKRTKSFGNWLLKSVAAHYVLFDVMAGVGVYDLAGFPPDVRSSRFPDDLRNSVARAFGVAA